MLAKYPQLLTYTVSGDGSLVKGPARASVDLVPSRDGQRLAGASFWREGAKFAGPPVAPYQPSA